jgi:hypothetical protein
MTTATCFNCGEIKFGAFVPCKHCGELPKEDEDWILSLAMTDHYFDLNTLKQMGEAVKRGEKPKLDEETKKNLMKQLIEQRNSPMGFLVGGTPRVTAKKKWWQL